MRNTIWLVAVSLELFVASSASAATIWLHEGKNDPATEGWTFNPALVNSAVAGPVGPVGPGEAEIASENAWKIVDPGTDTRPTYESLRMTPGQVTNLFNHGWEYTVRMSSPLASTTANTRGFQFITPGPPASGTIYRVYVTTDTSLNQTVRAYNLTGTQLATPAPISPGFHTYRLVGTPTGGGSFNVSLFIDDAQTPAINSITGFSKNTASLLPTITPTTDASFANFGSFNAGAAGTMHVSHASFVVIPEPATWGLACVGLLGFLSRIGRRSWSARMNAQRATAS